jgi:hypothetical protein
MCCAVLAAPIRLQLYEICNHDVNTMMRCKHNHHHGFSVPTQSRLPELFNSCFTRASAVMSCGAGQVNNKKCSIVVCLSVGGYCTAADVDTQVTSRGEKKLHFPGELHFHISQFLYPSMHSAYVNVELCRLRAMASYHGRAAASYPLDIYNYCPLW